MPPLTFSTTPGAHLHAGFASALVGALAVALSLAATGAEAVTRWAGFAIGLAFLGAGGAFLLLGGRQTICVDPARRAVVLRMESRLGAKEQVVPFATIARVSVGELGDDDGGSTSCFVELRLHDGATVALFLGPWEGRSDRAVALERARRVAGAAGLPGP